MQRDTSNWTPEHCLDRTAMARAARLEGVRWEQAQRSDAREKILQWIGWFGYSTTTILAALAGRSRRIVDELRDLELVHYQRQLIRGRVRFKRHGGQFSQVTTVFLTRSGHRSARTPTPLRKVPDHPELVRHNLLVQVATLRILDSHLVVPRYKAFTPSTLHLNELDLPVRLKPDALLDIDPPLIDSMDMCSMEEHSWRGVYFVEVERTRKHPSELGRLAVKLEELCKFGTPVLVTERRSTMDALHEKLSAFQNYMEVVAKIQFLILEEECPKRLSLLP